MEGVCFFAKRLKRGIVIVFVLFEGDPRNIRAQAANKICFELVYFAKTYLGADERYFLPVVTVVGQATVNSKFPM